MVDSAEGQKPSEPDIPQWRGWLGRVGDDWWATAVAGLATMLAVTDLLPKIPW